MTVEIAPGLHATPEGALWIPGDGILALSDVHVGFATGSAGHWFVLPSDQLVGIRESLSLVESRYSPSRVLVNGDFKHGYRPPASHETSEIRAAASALTARGASLSVARGNHDRGLEAALPATVELADRVDVSGFRFAHGHARAARPRDGWLVLGHEHAALNLRDEIGVGGRFKAFLVNPKRRIVVMPAFSPWAHGVDPRVRGFSGPNLSGLHPGEFNAFALDGESVLGLGRVSEIDAK